MPPARDVRIRINRWWPALALLAFVASRIYYTFIFAAGTSDIGVYFDYVVQGVDYGETPYSHDAKPVPYLRQLQNLEYPPVAYWVTALPRQLSHWRMPWRNPREVDIEGVEIIDSSSGRRLTPDEIRTELFLRERWEQCEHYAAHFRIWMLVFDVVGFALFCGILRRRRPDLLLWGMWGFTLSTSFLGYVFLERFDVVLTCSLLAWAYCWLRAAEPGAKEVAWSAGAYTALGLGISLKLIPVLIVPFALLCDLYALWPKPRRWSLLVGPVCLIAAAGLPFAYYYALVGRDLSTMFSFHAARGVQIESTYATLMMLLRPAEELTCYFDYGSWNIRGPLEKPLLIASTWSLLAVLAVLGLRSLTAPLLGERYDRVAAYRMACVVIPVATMLAKVFSVQYLLWAVPMLLLGAAEFFSRRGFIATVVLAVVACAFTGYLYPYHYLDHMKIFPFDDANPPPWSLIEMGNRGDGTGALTTDPPRTLMIARNVIYGLLCAVLYVAALRHSKTLLPRGQGGGVLADG